VDLPSGGNNNHGGRNSNNNNKGWWWRRWWNDGSDSSNTFSLLFLLSSSIVLQLASSAAARTQQEEGEEVWEVKGSNRARLIPDFSKDEFVVSPTSSSSLFSVNDLWSQCTTLFVRLMLPQGFPQSVTSDYLDYSLWRAVQGIASQISGVLATQVSIYHYMNGLLLFLLINICCDRHCFMLLGWGKELSQLLLPSIGC
jgi:hypothetical protein